MLTIQVNTMNKIALLIQELIKYNHGDKKRIGHALKVHSYAKTIAILEKVNEYDLFNLESAAILHDIGIKVCEEKYNSANGKLQEKEGPVIAEKLLSDLGFSGEVSERVQYLIAHHHTYNNIDGIDYQILVEADFLVNMCEDELSEEALQNTYQNIFRTETGKKICREMYDIA